MTRVKFNFILFYLTDTSTWQEVKAEGPKPSPRDKLQGTAIDTNIYYFGGFGPKQTGEEDDDEDWEDVSFHQIRSLLQTQHIDISFTGLWNYQILLLDHGQVNGQNPFVQ